MKTQTHHERLGLEPGCGKRAARDAFIAMTRKFHPDAFAGVEYSDGDRRCAQEIFMLVREAREHVVGAETSEDPKNSAFDRLASRTQSRLQGAGGSAPSRDALSQADAAYNSISGSSALNATSRSVDTGDERAERLKGLRRRTSQRSLQSTSSILNEVSSASHNPGVGEQRSQPLSEDERREKFAVLKKRRRPTRSMHESFNGLSRTSSGASLVEPSAPSTPPTRGLKPDNVSYSGQPFENLTPQQIFNIGYRDFTAGRYPEAVEPLRRAVEADPRNGLFLTIYGYVLFLNEPHEKSRTAEQMLRRAIDTENRQALPDAHLFLGRVLKRRGPDHYKKALHHFEEALELNPHSTDAQRELAELRQLTEPKKKPGAMGIISKIFKRD